MVHSPDARLFVVPAETHAVYFARRGVFAETRRALFRRLSLALLDHADTETIATRVEAQLAAAHAHGSPRAGWATERALDLLVDAHGDAAAALRALNKTRLRSLHAGCLRGNELLASHGLSHAREVPERLARAIAREDPARIGELVGARHVEARFLFDWSASDGAFFRALDLALSRVGGGASVYLPEVQARFDAAREESPHERVAMACARALDAAPRFFESRVPSTWALAAPREIADKVTLVRAADRSAEASACAEIVRAALSRGLAVDDIGIALPRRGGALEAEIVRAIEAHGLHAGHSDPELADSPVVRRFERALREKLPERATRGAFITAVADEVRTSDEAARGGVGAFGVLATDERPDDLGRAELVALSRSAAAWDALALVDYTAAVKRLELWDTEITLDAFLLEAWASLPAPRDPATRRAAALRIGTRRDFVGLPLGLLVIVAANDESDGVESAALADALLKRLLVERRAAESVSIATCIESAERLVFSFQSRDEDGGELAPAPYVAWLARGGSELREVGASPLGPARTSPRDRLLRALADAPTKSEALAPDAFARARVELTRERFFLDAARSAGDLTGILPMSAELRELLTRETGATRALSVTAVERMAECAFVGFAESVLFAREKTEEESLPSVRDEGNIVHAALARAFTACKELLSRPPSSRDLEAILETASLAVNAGFPEHTPEVIRARVRATVNALLQVASEDVFYTFHVAEQVFGGGGAGGEQAWPAHVIEQGGERLVLRGQIDRVDVSSDGRRTRVIDYKRRLTTIRRVPRSLGVTSLQVPLYACVSARALRKDRGESGFLPTDPRDLPLATTKLRGMEEAMARVLTETGGITEIERRTLDVVRGVRAGDIRPLPVDPGRCGHCPHDGACRKPRFSIDHDLEDGS